MTHEPFMHEIKLSQTKMDGERMVLDYLAAMLEHSQRISSQTPRRPRRSRRLTISRPQRAIARRQKAALDRVTR